MVRQKKARSRRSGLFLRAWAGFLGPFAVHIRTVCHEIFPVSPDFRVYAKQRDFARTPFASDSASKLTEPSGIVALIASKALTVMEMRTIRSPI